MNKDQREKPLIAIYEKKKSMDMRAKVIKTVVSTEESGLRRNGIPVEL